MEIPDNQVVNRVWQRVQQKPTSPEIPNLAPLLTALRQEAARYQTLFKLTKNSVYQTLLKQVNSQFSCVRGMLRLTGMSEEDFIPSPPHRQPLDAMLRGAYGSALGRLTEYEKYTSDSTFGPVFHVLAGETKSTLRTLCELFGAL